MNNFKLSGLVLFLAVAQTANAVSDLSCEIKELNGVQSLAVKKGKEVQTYTSARNNKVPMIFNFKATADASRAFTACTDAVSRYSCVSVTKLAMHEHVEINVPTIQFYRLSNSGLFIYSTYDSEEDCKNARLKKIAGKILGSNEEISGGLSVAEKNYWLHKSKQKFEIGRP